MPLGNISTQSSQIPHECGSPVRKMWPALVFNGARRCHDAESCRVPGTPGTARSRSGRWPPAGSQWHAAADDAWIEAEALLATIEDHEPSIRPVERKAALPAVHEQADGIPGARRSRCLPLLE